MNLKKLLTAIILTAMLFTAACTSKNGEKDTAADENGVEQQNDKEQNETKDNESAPEKDTETENDTEDDSSTADSSSDDQEIPDADQKSLIKEMAAQEVTNFSFELPENIPVTDGKHLTALTNSKENQFEMTFYESDEKLPVNDAAIENNSQKIAHLQIQQYNNQQQADEEISFEEYDESSGEPTDLGHQITGYQDAGAGSVFTSWNEGRWDIAVRATTENSEEGVALAKDVVDFLEVHALPAPKQYGTMHLDTENTGTIIQWEKGKTVYKIDDVHSIMDAVKIAAQFK